MDKKKYYKELRKTIAFDGKSHQSTITDDGIVIDGKFYGDPTPLIEDGKSHQGIRTKDGNLYGGRKIRRTIPQNYSKR